jgi:serine phosphatase RsbU (regulator of sigma subunit)
MEPGDRLLIFSDGVADGARASYKILKELESRHHNMSPAEIIELVKEMGRVSALIDDKVMLVLSYQPGSKKN